MAKGGVRRPGVPPGLSSHEGADGPVQQCVR